MQKKIWIIIAVVFLICGIGLFVFGMQNLGWDYRELSTSKYENHTYEVEEDFVNIKIDTTTADIIFYPLKDGKCRVECHENERFKYDVSVNDKTLTVKATDDRNWYDHIGFNLGFSKISVFLPETDYNLLDIKASTGDINITDKYTFKDISLKLSTGDVTLKYLNCENLSSTGSTGDIRLKGVTVNNKLSLKRSTGDIEIKGSDALEIDIKTATGDVSGTLLSDKIFITESNTGTVKVPKTTSGGRCKIKTTTGDINISIKE